MMSVGFLCRVSASVCPEPCSWSQGVSCLQGFLLALFPATSGLQRVRTFRKDGSLCLLTVAGSQADFHQEGTEEEGWGPRNGRMWQAWAELQAVRCE